MFKNTFQSGFLSILYSIGSKPLQIWDKKVRLYTLFTRYHRHSDSWMATRLPSSMHRFYANLQFITNILIIEVPYIYSNAFSNTSELAKHHMHIYVHLFTHGSGHVNNLTVSKYVSLTCYLNFNVYLNNAFSFVN